ncbi:caspase family protein [Streptomyces sp. ME02-8801-2C]|uniref:caspase family protein n=1 Tax=Streptomyces sp. ME02-8801-2C TaxID=3028680 RepID=UPI0029AB7E3B|nr:caspase family protein [Streptomyces sp. ME02-8801-2C]MDX3451631.1 caspase family protein [Streptomyces sp. ME02-8801-2C]
MGNGISLHIGLNRVDPTRYGGWDGKLMACENDARDMEQIARNAGFDNRTMLLTADATVDNVTAELRQAARVLTPGDILLLTYSGHGGQVPDKNGPEDESDRLDETLVFYDREFIDDELYKEFEAFAPGVRISAYFDCCHSETAVKAMRRLLTPDAMEEQYQTRDPDHIEVTSRVMPPDVQRETYARDKTLYDTIQQNLDPKDTVELAASVLLISACADNQLAADGWENGLFTGTLREVWGEGKFTGGHKSFQREILRRMPPNQSPGLFVTGSANNEFLQQRPFTV